MRHLVCGFVLTAWLAGSQAHADSTRGARRIISLAPNVTELVFAAGAGEKLIGVVEHSDYPAAARQIPRVGDAFRVDLERVLMLQPDVILAWRPGTPEELITRLRELGLTVQSVETRRLADIPEALRTIGRIAAVTTSADASARQFASRIEALRSRYADRALLTVFLQVDDRPIYTINGQHILSEALTLCGGRNVFAELRAIAPVVGVEAVLKRDPQVILVTDSSGEQALQQWRRWAHLQAVRMDAASFVSADQLMRPTPRLAEGIEHLCQVLDRARVRYNR